MPLNNEATIKESVITEPSDIVVIAHRSFVPRNANPLCLQVGRPVSSVCVVRPHSRQSFSEDKPRAVSADSR